jgi:hypothetical protein
MGKVINFLNFRIIYYLLGQLLQVDIQLIFDLNIKTQILSMAPNQLFNFEQLTSY